MHLPTPDKLSWHLVTAGTILKEDAATLLDQFTLRNTFDDWAWNGENPLLTLSLIETSLTKDEPVDAFVRDCLNALHVRWAWVKRGRCIQGAEIVNPDDALYFRPDGDRGQELRLISLLMDVHLWDGLCEPRTGHQTLTYMTHRAKLTPVLNR